MQNKVLIPLFLFTLIQPLSLDFGNHTQQLNLIKEKGIITRNESVRRVSGDTDSSYEIIHTELFGSYQINNERALLGTSLVNRFILRTYIDGGFSIYDCEYEQFSEYTLEGTCPYESILTCDTLLYIGPGSLCFKLPDGTYKDLEDNIYNESSLLQMAQEEAELKRLQAQYEASQAEDNNISTYGMVNDSSEGGNSYDRPDSITLDGETYIYNYDYYTKLQDFGYNNDGSCPLIAIEMLTGYYDALYDDSIIDDIYNVTVNSPLQSGTYRIYQFDKSPGTTESFSFYLKQLAIEYEYAFFDDYGMTYPEMRSMFRCYMETVRGFKLNTDYKIQGIEGNRWDKITGNCKKRVKAQIDAGMPQIIGLSTYEHACIAYGYNDDCFILNYGSRYDLSPRYVNKSYAESNIGISEWMKARTDIPDRYMEGSKKLDPIIDLGVSASGATHSTFTSPTRS